MEITLWWKWLIILNFNIIMKIHKINKSQMHPVMHVCPLLDIVSSKVFHDMLLFYCICCNQVCNWKTLAVRLHVHFTCCSTWCFACVWCSVSVETLYSLWCLLYWTRTYRHVTCPRPDTSAACSAGSGSGWCGQSGSSSDAGMSTQHCSADSSWRNPTGPRDGQREGWLTHAGLDSKNFFLLARLGHWLRFLPVPSQKNYTF